MSALAEIQNEVFRIYALAAYDDESRTLSKEEKDDLELFFEISAGSTGAAAKNSAEVFERILLKALEKMPRKHVAVVVTVGAIGFGSFKLLDRMIASHERIAIAETQAQIVHEQTAQSQQDTERMRMLYNLSTSNAAVVKALEATEAAHEAIAKSIKGHEKVIMPDKEKTEITEQVAKEFFPKSKRRKPEVIRMDGIYTIKEVKNREGELRLTIADVNGKEYGATASLSNPLLCQSLSAAVPMETTLNLEINARDFEGEKRDIVVLDIKGQTSVSAPN